MTISLAAEPIGHLGSLVVTNSLLVGWCVTALLSFGAFFLFRRVTLVPRGAQNLFEVLFEQLLSYADAVTGDRTVSLRFFPFVATIFFFVLFCNWIGLLPGFGSIGIWEMTKEGKELIPLFRGASADLNFTLSLALISVVATQIYGMRTLGTVSYWSKFFVPPWKQPYVIGTFVGLLELVSECAKVISFSFRLFGNVFAGEVLLLVMATLAPLLTPIPFLFMEIFVGVVQASVFAMLTLVFCSIAIIGHGDDHHENQHESTHHA